MKKYLFSIVMMCFAIVASAQIKKPELMVIPSDVWCINNGYYTEVENMGVIGQVSPRLLLRPLLTFDKLDIMAVAAKIGTAPLSIEDVPDSCTVFAPKSPATRTVPAEIEGEEAKLDVHALVRECLKGTVIMNPRTYAEHAFTELLDLYG